LSLSLATRRSQNDPDAEAQARRQRRLHPPFQREVLESAEVVPAVMFDYAKAAAFRFCLKIAPQTFKVS
jgi:hypothetical protein